jgi:hypothetical protein
MAGTRAVIAAAAVLLAGPTLAGCSGGDPVPKVEPSSSGSSPAASSGSPSPSQVALSPEDTVRAWVAAQNTAMHTGDVSELRTFGDGQCRGCDDFISRIADVYRHGGYYKGGAWRVAAIKVTHRTSHDVTVNAAVDFAGGVTVNKKGDAPRHYGPDKAIMEFWLVPGHPRWLIHYIGFVG